MFYISLSEECGVSQGLHTIAVSCFMVFFDPAISDTKYDFKFDFYLLRLQSNKTSTIYFKQ